MKDPVATLNLIRTWQGHGLTLDEALRRVDVSKAWYRRWTERIEAAGLHGAQELPRAGRPPKVELNDAEAKYLAEVYIRSNRGKEAGSMTAAARIAAKDEQSPLRPETRQVILGLSNKHALPTAIKRAMRLGRAVVAKYRNPKAGQNDGIYVPGFLRMVQDGSRRLVPGERQVWDDASINFGCYVPWPQGGDKCSDKFGVRLARYQLLLGIDCATDFCVGWSYVRRANDAYRAADVASALQRCWRDIGYAPNELVVEGGVWQSERVKAFVKAAGVSSISAKGRPNQKLVEGYFNRLWTVQSALEPRGHVGRFRGELVKETANWTACREGARDPRTLFLSLSETLELIDKSVRYLNDEVMQSATYGRWVPSEVYGAQLHKGHRLPDGMAAYALPVREVRTMLRGGMIEVKTEAPFGLETKLPYQFACEEGYLFEGARVMVAFDPAEIGNGAQLTLAKKFCEWPKGHVIAEAATCVSVAPCVERSGDGWRAFSTDGRVLGTAVKKASAALIGRTARAYDKRGRIKPVKVAPVVTLPKPKPEAAPKPIDWAREESGVVLY